MDLLILAGGMGSRFGGLKQIEPIHKNGEFIIDYSIYDAIKAGFDRVVFLIKEETFDIFRETVGKRVEKKIKTEYVFQKLDNLPAGFRVPEGREKPWGTAHAILCCKDVIKDNFAILNADDFYGRDAFKKAYDFLQIANDKNFGLIGYRAQNTITENGSVKRGVCELENGKLVGINESTIEKDGDHIHCASLVTGDEYDIEFGRLVSMNMLLFTPKIFEYLENDFLEFFKNLKDENKDEFLIPEVVSNHIKNGDITVDVIETSSVWYGVTYKEDKDSVKNAIKDLIDSNEYKENLWS